MATIRFGLAVLNVVCLFAPSSLAATTGENLLVNGDFETADGSPWQPSVRPSMWKITPGESNMLRIAQGRAHSGRRSLVFGPTTGEKPEAIFTSQHVNVTRHLADNARGAVQISFWHSGALASKLRAHLDIGYADGRYLFARIAPGGDSSGDKFVRACAFIPSYGPIRVIMLHLVVEAELDSAVYVDDVDVHVTDHYDASCPLYTEKLPVARHVTGHFLSPARRPNPDGVTLATQMTTDRLPLLAKTAERWQGPISAAILLLSRHGSIAEQTRALIAAYYRSPHLRDHVTVHLVTDDQFNGDDASLYPVNFLRNVALENGVTSHVFFVDADIIPAFSERVAAGWVKQAAATHRDDPDAKYALIAPLFTAKEVDIAIPADKPELLRRLKDEPIQLEPFRVVSHSVVRYNQWYTSDAPYRVDYQSDMEPYFIVPRSAPLMHDIYAGYGRDKCAYSRDLNAAGYSFYVLPEAFLVNRKESPGAPTIYQRSNGLGLRVFLNIEFHRKDLDAGVLKRPRHPPDAPTVNATSEHLEMQLPTPDEVVDCNHRLYGDNMQSSPASLPLSIHVPDNRYDILIEGIMVTYGTVVYMSVPTPVEGAVSVMMPYMQPDAVVSVIPSSAGSDDHEESGLFHTYRAVSSNATHLLNVARREHPGAAIIHVNLRTLHDDAYALAVFQSALRVANDSDVIVVSGGPELTSLHSAMCAVRPSWTLHLHGETVVLKSAKLTSAPPERVPPPPAIARMSTLDVDARCSDVSADVILMTRNRPLQTLAFLESLANHVTGVNKVWLVQRADDALFIEAYATIVSCLAGRLNIAVVPDDRRDFGGRVESVLRGTTATSVMLAVDEIIWLRDVDLRRAACLLHVADGEVAAFQLRLGENLGRTFDDDPRFVPLKHSPEMFVYYPRRMRYDFGYVTHVDGLLMRTRDLLADLADVLPDTRHPGILENAWLRRRLHVRSRQWHLVYRHSRLVNNMSLKDGRVAASATPADASFDLALVVLDEKRKIDVALFAETNKFHGGTHISAKVHYTDLKCPLR